MKTSAFPKVLHIGDKQIEDLFKGDVEITEKLDGSQFGFGMIAGELVCRSKGKEIDIDNPEKLFEPAVEYVKSIERNLPAGWFFYAETLSKPRHSTLAYDRVPKNHIALFGLYNTTERVLLPYTDIETWAQILGVDVVPLIYSGLSDPETVIAIVEKTESYLGGHKVEGVVVKRYEPWLFLGTIPLPVKAGKFVSERFKEVHEKDWKKLNTGKGKWDAIKGKYKTEARWWKAVQHLKEAGKLEGSPRDIGSLVKELKADLIAEEKENIKEELWKLHSPELLRMAGSGFPEWYKEKLALGEIDV